VERRRVVRKQVCEEGGGGGEKRREEGVEGEGEGVTDETTKIEIANLSGILFKNCSQTILEL
jgi:hypothetical protein